MKANKEIMIDEQTPDTQEEIILNQEQIDDWKRQYGKIYRTVVGDLTVIWRMLRRNEYVDAMVDEDLSENPDKRIFERQEAIVKKVCLYPANIAELIESEGGLATCLAGEISEKSGFVLPVTSEL